MRRFAQVWVAVVAVLVIVSGAILAVAARHSRRARAPRAARGTTLRTHLDHSPFFPTAFKSPQAVTQRCLECHTDAAHDVMRTAHWQWLGPEERVAGRAQPVRMGKKNLLNNFCIGIQGNWATCTSCHAGYGWSDEGFDFAHAENVDCLVCHDWSGRYVKGAAGMPKPDVDLAAVARSVGYPRRENCGACHFSGGGGMGVKHGDLDASLSNPDAGDDVHMGRYGLLCIDCHRTERHDIRGRSISVGTGHANGIGCEDCHDRPPHADARLNAHLSAVACSTCHIPTFSRAMPTKMVWDWSQAGDAARTEDPHTYLKIKGAFVYQHDVVPTYAWFNLTADRYLLGDTIDPTRRTAINRPRGDIADGSARIWPFKVHRARQPYDAGNRTLAPVVTSGSGGYWHDFDWDKALRLGARVSGTAYSGRYGFAETEMYWPLSHQVTPKSEALKCDDCHGSGGRMDWTALGYRSDPMTAGGRR